jgi:hypothetical protein
MESLGGAEKSDRATLEGTDECVRPHTTRVSPHYHYGNSDLQRLLLVVKCVLALLH